MNFHFSQDDRTAIVAAAFADFPMPLRDLSGRRLGVTVMPLTPWRMNLLALYRSPAVTGAAFDRLSLLQALFLLSPSFRLGSRWRFPLFVATNLLLPLRKTERALREHVAAAFEPAKMIVRERDLQLSPDGAAPRPQLLWLAEFIFMSSRALGIPESDLLYTPYARIFQYMAVASKSGEDRPDFTGDERALGERLRARIAARTQSSTPSPS